MVKLVKESDVYKVECWNRLYTYDNSVFPSSIKIGGEEILYAPITLNAKFGDVDGEWKNHYKRVFEEKEDSQTFVMSMETENIILNASITSEEDGLLKTSFTVIPYWDQAENNVPTLTELWIDIPVKKKFATLMHFYPGGSSAVSITTEIFNSGAVPRDKLSLPFKAYTWLGWDNGGVGICTESDENFVNKNKDSVYVIENNDEYVNLRINIMDDMPENWKGGRREIWGDNFESYTFTFGLQATPVKEFPKRNLIDWRVVHTGFNEEYYNEIGNGDTYLEKVASKGTKCIIFHENWSVFQNYGEPQDKEKFIEVVKKCHKLGMKVGVYFGYEVSSLLPMFHEKKDNYLLKNANGNTTGGWQRKPAQRDYIACYKGDYKDVMLERVKYVMDELGVDVIYTDGTYQPWECANENHGCGYRDKEGKLHSTYPIFAVREHVKKLYTAIHERGGWMDTHQSSCCLTPTLSYADSYFDGENIQHIIWKGIEKMDFDAFRAEYMGTNMGIPCNFIVMTYSDDDKREAYTIRQLAGVTLLHNVYPRAWGKLEHVEFMSDIWNIYDEFDIMNATWCPYWENKEIETGNPKVYLSYYKKDNDYLLIIDSLDENVKELRLDIECEGIKDYLDNNAYCDADAKCVVIPLEYTKLKICKLTGIR